MSEEQDSADDTLAGTYASTQPGAGAQRRDAADAVLRRGTVVGRYVVLSRLGAGGMGMVYAAYDPELDRKVALKLLRPTFGGASTEARARLVREAQALAKLQHPNVVTIHDVGTHEDQVWLAMEHVEGRTLDAWRKERRRSWPEVLDVVMRAGRGVAAAHTAGLLHRDLKPDNLMVATDGRVRVMDFGLARARGHDGETEDAARDEDVPQPRHQAWGVHMTQTGSLLGTPAYMAPEQFRGGDVDEATDQFSLCATLWEALYGERPFAGETLVELMTRVLEGERRPPPRSARVPGWLRRVVERGLSPEPQRRWPSMKALLEALERGHERARVRGAVALAALVGLGAAAFMGMRDLDRRRGIAACERAGESITAVWNEEARQRVREALVGTEVSHAEVTADKVMPWLDAHALAWQTARTESCLDADVREVWDEDVYARATWCLDERWNELEALIERLSSGSPESVHGAVLGVAGLERVEPCRERELLVRRPSPPAEHRETVRSLRIEVSRAKAMQHTGAFEAGIEVARDALERAKAVEWPPLAAAAGVRLGALLTEGGAYGEAEEVLETAYLEAARAGAVEVATQAAVELVSVVGERLGRHSEGLRWSRLADVGLSSHADVTRMHEAQHLVYVGNVHWAMGSYEKAKAVHERALAIREDALGPEHPAVAMSLNNLAAVHQSMGAHHEATPQLERALVIWEETLGPEHPLVATALHNLAISHQAIGSYAKAKRLCERALTLRERAVGPEHRDVAMSLDTLGSIHRSMGSFDEARPLLERALAIMERTLGPEHPETAATLSNLANAHKSMGSYEEAIGLYRRSLAIQEARGGARSHHVGTTLYNLANVHRDMGNDEEARGLYERALAIWEEALGPDHPHVAYALRGLAELALQQGRAADAATLAARTVTLRENAAVSARHLAEARFVLARAAWEAGLDRVHALDLAEAAREGWLETGETAAVAEVEAWLAKRGRAR